MKLNKTVLTRITFLFVCLLGFLIYLKCFRKPAAVYERQFLYFDTVISLQFSSDRDGDALMDHCVAMCEDYENTFSRTKEDSELYAINHRTSNDVEVSPEIAYLVSVGHQYYQLSDHKFDFTIAPLSDLWNFTSEDASVPDASLIQESLKSVDASSVTVDGNHLIFSSADTQIDLGALVKGYAADQIKSYLKDNGVKSGILNLGGNVLTIGNRPDKKPWRVAIQKPFSSTGEYLDVCEISDQTAVTSGIYQRYFEQDGVIYHHILDPQTGYPATTDIQGVTILTDSSLTGDALSTTCLILGYEKARELIDSLDDTEAVFILNNQDIIKTF